MYTRRPFARLIAVAAVAALALSACGGGGDDESAAGASSSRTVTSTFTDEEVEIPAEPQRVVALWRTGSILADLGVTPTAQLEGELVEDELGAEVYETVKDVPVIGTYEGVDVEKLIEADPDLIIGMDNGGLGLDYDEISQVAPTVIIDIAEPTDVWDSYPEVADLLGKTTDYEEKQATLDASLAAIDDEYGDVLADTAATALGMSEGSIWVSTSKSLTYRRTEAAGFGYNPDYTDDPERYVEELAAENLPDLANSKILFYFTDIEGNPLPEDEKLISMPSFQRLPAAKAGHAYGIGSGVNYTFAAAQKQVDDLAKAAASYAADQ